jgi:hypothetical protein
MMDAIYFPPCIAIGNGETKFHNFSEQSEIGRISGNPDATFFANSPRTF